MGVMYILGKPISVVSYILSRIHTYYVIIKLPTPISISRSILKNAILGVGRDWLLNELKR